MLQVFGYIYKKIIAYRSTVSHTDISNPTSQKGGKKSTINSPNSGGGGKFISKSYSMILMFAEKSWVSQEVHEELLLSWHTVSSVCEPLPNLTLTEETFQNFSIF